ncbi:MAG: Rad52/22 double-strand break repair protein, partial [Angelakisella sp.]|nr:Rad52/22 double-strand break repair protein [Angelakisella sp.]
MNEQELTKRLTAPFEAQDVEWRIQQTTQDKSRGLAVA